MSSILIWAIAAGTIAGILFRPREWPEAVWACLGAILIVVCGLLPLSEAGAAVLKGTDVYLFLTGMMLLADLARREGVFDWLAALAMRAARGSRHRLFLLVYLVGTVVTVFLSNDATAVVLTPAVYAAVKRARGNARPYPFACALIANAASFVLPISNPANLVVFGRQLPPLLPWLRLFALPSLASIGMTYLALRLFFRSELEGPMESGGREVTLSIEGRRALYGIAFTGSVLLTASALGRDLGFPTLIAALLCAIAATAASLRKLADLARGISWSVIPLVAGLFVLVAAMNRAGASVWLGDALRYCASKPPWGGTLLASFGIAAVSNIMNNLPSGLLAGSAVQAQHVAENLRNAVLIGVDLGPNLSVTGSLATVLWLIALRREGYKVGGFTFLKCGVLAMPPALLFATLALLV